MIMASNMGPSLATNSIIRWISASKVLSVGITTFTVELETIRSNSSRASEWWEEWGGGKGVPKGGAYRHTY